MAHGLQKRHRARNEKNERLAMVRILSSISLTGLIWFSLAIMVPTCYARDISKKNLKPDCYLIVKNELKLIDMENLAANASLIQKNTTWYFGFHGWHASVNDSPLLPNMVKALQKTCGNCNVIQVDWEELAEPWYSIAVKNAKYIAKYMADVINDVIKGNQFGNVRVHLDGFSLGAHLAGFTAKYMYSTYKIKPARITAIEPAGPIFSIATPDKRVDRSDADYVQVVHTSGRTLGIWKPIGHVDFYLNGGNAPQPPCVKSVESSVSIATITCSHQIAKKLFAETAENTKIIGFKCASWEDFVAGNCKADQNQSPQTCLLGLETKQCPDGVYNAIVTLAEK